MSRCVSDNNRLKAFETPAASGCLSLSVRVLTPVLPISLTSSNISHPAAVLTYDYLITLPDEVQFFWTGAFPLSFTLPSFLWHWFKIARGAAGVRVPKTKRIISWPVLLFYLCRYFSLLGHVPVVYAAFADLESEVHPVRDSRFCKLIQLFHGQVCERWQYYHQLFTGVSIWSVSGAH